MLNQQVAPMKKHTDLKVMAQLVWAAWFLLLALLVGPMMVGLLLTVGQLLGRQL
jgi:hypothetical protein